MTWKPKRLTRQQMEERRLAGGRLLRKRRLTRTQIARRLGASRAAVSQWAKRLGSGGVRRLRAHKSTGRPSKLTPQQQRVLSRKLKRGARAAGFPTWEEPGRINLGCGVVGCCPISLAMHIVAQFLIRW